ncbi:MAG: hypothetical protein JJU02_05640 [Cryomorphaceae bacterium]|nr:hypothetical protein [Cryomorphaceae bacterium]
MKTAKLLLYGLAWLHFFATSYVAFGQTETFVGPQLGFFAYTTVLQNNYGQPLLSFFPTTDLRPGFTIGALHNRRHQFQVAIKRMNANQVFEDHVFRKEQHLSYLSIPITYSLILNPKRKYKYKWYLTGGVGFNLLEKADVMHFVNGNLVRISDYAAHEINHLGPNPHSNKINDIFSAPKNYDHSFMFRNLDFTGVGAMGFQRVLTKCRVSVELYGLISLRDTYVPEWQFPRRNGRQTGTYNLFGGVQITMLCFL